LKKINHLYFVGGRVTLRETSHLKTMVDSGIVLQRSKKVNHKNEIKWTINKCCKKFLIFIGWKIRVFIYMSTTFWWGIFFLILIFFTKNFVSYRVLLFPLIIGLWGTIFQPTIFRSWPTAYTAVLHQRHEMHTFALLLYWLRVASYPYISRR
jgi:hypothetical protein